MSCFIRFICNKKTIVLFVLSLNGFAQKQADTWYFGDLAGLRFTNGVPVIITNGQTTLSSCSPTCHAEGSSVMSDSAGSLLFYTNGQTVWNKNHQIMPNGNNLMGHSSSSQSSLIVPKPGSKRYYYIFTTPAYQHNFQDGFRYSIVDICADNGKGDIIPNQKNVKILDTIAEKLTGVLHANGSDYWIIVHKYQSSDFYAYHLSPAGITNTVITTIGSSHPAVITPTLLQQAVGPMKASPNGQKIAIVMPNPPILPTIVEYFDFNTTTGVLSNSVNLNLAGGPPQCYGISFSPDNSKLYFSSLLTGIVGHPGWKGVFQYDLAAGNGHPDSVRASLYQVTSLTQGYFGLQLATNGKIYIARGAHGNTYLSVINSPNSPGPACGFVDSALNVGKIVSYGLPNFIDSFKYIEVQTGPDACETVVGIHDDVMIENQIWPNPFNTFIQVRNAVHFKALDFTLFDSFGKEIFSSSVPSDGIVRFDLLEVPGGIYFYQLKETGVNTILRHGKVLKE